MPKPKKRMKMTCAVCGFRVTPAGAVAHARTHLDPACPAAPGRAVPLRQLPGNRTHCGGCGKEFFSAKTRDNHAAKCAEFSVRASDLGTIRPPTIIMVNPHTLEPMPSVPVLLRDSPLPHSHPAVQRMFQ